MVTVVVTAAMPLSAVASPASAPLTLSVTAAPGASAGSVICHAAASFAQSAQLAPAGSTLLR